MGVHAYELVFDCVKHFNKERKHHSLKLFKEEDIFLLAILERNDENMTPNIDTAMYLYERYLGTNEIPVWMQEWCIDVMVGRHETASFGPNFVQKGE
jgi:hypothetical protein